MTAPIKVDPHLAILLANTILQYLPTAPVTSPIFFEFVTSFNHPGFALPRVYGVRREFTKIIVISFASDHHRQPESAATVYLPAACPPRPPQWTTALITPFLTFFRAARRLQSHNRCNSSILPPTTPRQTRLTPSSTI
jgi:hypothetical protein